MCRLNFCPCDISGATGGWNEITQDDLENKYDSLRTQGNFYFADGGYANYDACILGAEEGEVDAEFFAFAKGFREQDDFA